MKPDRSNARNLAEALFAATQKRPAAAGEPTPQQAEDHALREKTMRLKALREARDKAAAEQREAVQHAARLARAKRGANV